MQLWEMGHCLWELRSVVMGFEVTSNGRRNTKPVSGLLGHQQWEKKLRKVKALLAKSFGFKLGDCLGTE